MSYHSFLHRFTAKRQNQASLSIVILSDGIHLFKVNATPTFYKLQDKNWEAALDGALKSERCANQSANVVLGGHFYQSYQVDEPAVPKEEWPVALPFLLKDIITDRVTDVIADGIKLPHSTKIQAYVIHKRVLEQIQSILVQNAVRLERLVPEDEVWAHAETQTSEFMLLHRNGSSEYKIGAFVERQSVFQRTIRGVTPPITGEYSNSLQLDGLALELQRSMDYLSSQLKQAQVNKLYFSCDNEEPSELQAALQERLNVSVEPLSSDLLGCGSILAVTTDHIPEQGVNLYPTHLKPKKEHFNLANVVASWLILTVLFLAVYGYYGYHNGQLDEQITQLKAESKQLTSKIAQLDKQLQKHKPSPAKLAAVGRLTDDIKAKQDSLKVIDSFDSEQLEGFSGVMSSLAILGRNDISLSKIQMSDNHMNISGLARNPEVVPNWVQQFKNEMHLVGRTFQSFSVGRDEEDRIIFSLRAKAKDRK